VSLRDAARALGQLVLLALVLGLGARAETVAPPSAVPSDRAARELLLDAARAGDRLVAVGTWGHVVLSDDGGGAWRQAQRVPTQALLTDVFFSDARRGWAVGHDAVILHTGDGGETWELQHADPDAESPLFSVWFRDARHGLAVGAFGLALETRDGGARWERVTVEEAEIALHLNEVFANADGDRFIAAESGVVYRAGAGDAVWTRIQTPYDGSLWGGLALTDRSLLVFGMRGTVLRSVDEGDSWQTAPSGTDGSLGGGAELADGRIVLAGLGGAVAVSRDAGRSFEASVRSHRRGANAVLPLDGERVLLLGDGGVETWAVPLGGGEAAPFARSDEPAE
jgi:photosystem II stability/assembly factor-like uncharacterized protein